MFESLGWDGEFGFGQLNPTWATPTRSPGGGWGVLFPERHRGSWIGVVGALDIAPFLINKQGSVDTDGPDCYLNHSNDAVTVRNNIENSSIDILVVIHNTWYKRKLGGDKGGKLNEETKQYPYTLKYGETHTETNKEGRSDVKWGTDSIVDTDITITLVRITQPKTDITGKQVVDETGKPVLTTTDAAGGAGVTDLPAEQYKEYAMYAGVIVVVAALAYGAYWYISRQPAKEAKS